MKKKRRAPRNRTLVLSEDARRRYRSRLLRLDRPFDAEHLANRTINQDLLSAVKFLPEAFVDLLVIDPPYNLNKCFNGRTFSRKPLADYTHWVDSWLSPLVRTLKRTASVYICADWQSSSAIHEVASRYFIVRNRITWQREKGRGALSNWKNCSEDIWFCTRSGEYVFNVEDVKLKRRVLAPYTNDVGAPRDWHRTPTGRFRETHPSNLWTDLTVPFWSMAENTDHPAQKPEKLVAKIILASSRPGDVVLDPFLGSGTTSVVAKKLAREYLGIELDEEYCLLAERRLDLAEQHGTIQGYADGVFWERNTFSFQTRSFGNNGQRP